MKKKTQYVHRSKWFYGHKISEYGLCEGYVDYATLASCFDAVRNDNIMDKTKGRWEAINGFDEEDNLKELYEFHIVSKEGARMLVKLTNEPVFYNEELNMYVWGIGFSFGSWEFCVTNIPVELKKEKPAWKKTKIKRHRKDGNKIMNRINSLIVGMEKVQGLIEKTKAEQQKYLENEENVENKRYQRTEESVKNLCYASDDINEVIEKLLKDGNYVENAIV